MQRTTEPDFEKQTFCQSWADILKAQVGTSTVLGQLDPETEPSWKKDAVFQTSLWKARMIKLKYFKIAIYLRENE